MTSSLRHWLQVQSQNIQFLKLSGGVCPQAPYTGVLRTQNIPGPTPVPDIILDPTLRQESSGTMREIARADKTQ